MNISKIIRMVELAVACSDGRISAHKFFELASPLYKKLSYDEIHCLLNVSNLLEEFVDRNTDASGFCTAIEEYKKIWEGFDDV